MEQHSSIFENGLNETAKAYLLETTRWTKFLAIMSFIFCGIILLASFITLFTTASYGSSYALGATIGRFIYFLCVGSIYIYPAIALIRFTSNIKRGILNEDMEALTEGFRHQKNLYRYLGIMLIIGLVVLLVAGIIAGIAGMQ